MDNFENGKTLFDRVDGALVLDRMQAYWDGLRNGRNVPYRSEVDPRAVQKMLKHAFILERAAPGVARLRVSCNTLTDLQGMDMRGMPITAIIGEESRDEFRDLLEEVFAAPATARIDLSTSRGYRGDGISASMLLLPLRSDTGDINRILGAIAVEGLMPKSPQRFELVESLTHRLSVADDVLAEQLAPRTTPLPVSLPKIDASQKERGDPLGDMEVLTKTKTDDVVAQSKPTRHAHLRLVVSDE